MKRPSAAMRKALRRARLMAFFSRTSYRVTFTVGLPPDRTMRIRVREGELTPEAPQRIPLRTYLVGRSGLI